MLQVPPPTNLRDLEKLARLGDFGAAANNVHRDLMAFVGDMTCVAATKAFILPFKDTESLQHILLPHEVFASLYRHYEKAWLKTMVGYEVSNLPAFGWVHKTILVLKRAHYKKSHLVGRSGAYLHPAWGWGPSGWDRQGVD